MHPTTPANALKPYNGRERRSNPGRQSLAAALAACAELLERDLAVTRIPITDAAALPLSRANVCEVGKLARQHDVPPQRVLAVFKDMVSRLPSVERKPSLDRDEITRELVQIVIAGYYGKKAR